MHRRLQDTIHAGAAAAAALAGQLHTVHGPLTTKAAVSLIPGAVVAGLRQIDALRTPAPAPPAPPERG